MPQTAPSLTFVVPAYNAAKTLEVTIKSLKAQTRQDWQVVIIDDGSTDSTHEIAQRLAGTDSRFKVLRQANGGVSSARNTGVSAADAPFICLLDADDWLDRRYMEKMLPPLLGRQQGFATHCSYLQILNGELSDKGPAYDLTGNGARDTLSSWCYFAVFAVVFSRADYLRVGGMNTTLRTSEDWEFWLKLAFADVQFLRVDGSLGTYDNQAGSLSGDYVQTARDVLQVVEYARQLNADHCPEEPEISRNDRFDRLRAMKGGWYAGWQIAAGQAPDAILSLISPMPDLSRHESGFATAVFQGLSLGETRQRARDLQESCDWHESVRKVFAMVEAAGYPGMARYLWAELLAKIAQFAPPDTARQVGSIYTFSVDINSRPDIKRPEGADLMVVALTTGQKTVAVDIAPMWGNFGVASLKAAIGRQPRAMLSKLMTNPLALAAFTGRVSLSLMRELRPLGRIALREPDRKPALKSYLGGMLRRNFATLDNRAHTSDGLEVARRRIEALRGGFTLESTAANTPETPASPELPKDEAAYWEEVFANPDPWNYLSEYETVKYQQTLSLIMQEPAERAIEVACAEGIFTRMLAPQVDHLYAVDISTRALERAALRCRDLSNIDFSPLNLLTSRLPPNLDLIVCSEVLYYIDKVEDLRPIAAKFADALRDDGRFITAHAHIIADEPGRTGFDWGDQFGVATIHDIFAATAGLVLEQTIETELYAVHVFRKTEKAISPVVTAADFGSPLETEVQRHVVWGGAIKRRNDAIYTESTDRVPVLMYHRVADSGPDSLSEWRVTPDSFEAQLRLLRRHGFYSVTSERLAEHVQTRRRIPGRPVLITFDDAYQDFADNAFPILERNDFNAEVFVVTGKVGQTSDWDAQYGTAAPLMNWNEIVRLSQAGVRFGSHMASHTASPRLNNDDLLEEAARSKLELEQHLGMAVTSIAMPYGHYDRRVEPVLDLCGYDIGFSTHHAIASLDDRPLCMPRINIGNHLSLDDFARLLEIVS